MAKKLKGFKGLWIVFALAAVLTIAGCSDNTPFSPDTDENAALGKTSLSTGDTGLEAEVTATVDVVDGGSLVLVSDSYSHVFEVEKNSVDSTVVISASVEKSYIKRKEAVIFEFGPDGLVFSKSAQLTFDTDELASRDGIYNFYYYDPSVGTWILQASKRSNKGVVEFDVNHFSKYAISD